MKTLFKVWNILIIIGAVLSLLGVILLIAGFGALGTSVEGAGAVAGAGMLIIAISAIPAVISAIISFIAAKAGLTGDYVKCAKFGMIILVLNIISLVICLFSDGSIGSAVISTFFSAVYVWLAKKM